MKENNEQNFDTETSEFKKCYSLNSDSFKQHELLKKIIIYIIKIVINLKF